MMTNKTPTDDSDEPPHMTDSMRAIAELMRRRQQQLLIADHAKSTYRRLKAEGKAEGYQASIDVLRDMEGRDNAE